MIYDRPMWPPGAESAAQAFEAFDAWCAENNPDGERTLVELIDAYGKWPHLAGRVGDASSIPAHGSATHWMPLPAPPALT